MGCGSSGCRRGGVYDPSAELLGIQPLPASQRRGSKPTLLFGRKAATDTQNQKEPDEDGKEEAVTESTASTSARRSFECPRTAATVATPKRARARPGGKSRGAAAALLTHGSPRCSKEGSGSPATGSTTGPAPPSHSEESAAVGTLSATSSFDAQAPRHSPPAQPKTTCCNEGCFGNFQGLLRKPGDGRPERACDQPGPLQLPIGGSGQERREVDRRLRLVELNRRFAAAQEAAKGVPLSSEEKLQLYAYQKQAIEGPVFGNPPSTFNVAARAKWDAWAKLKCMDQDIAKQGYCALVDKFAPGWRSRAGV